ncbi:rhamnose mutarotase [Dentipellis sp. KUC8613]|nr:rhamnose mutarotase [Dentipellis sp. KUC8613]
MSSLQAKRVCQIVKLKPEAKAEYKAIHAAVWPSVLAAIERAHIVDYSIHYHPPLHLLIATFKYTGSDFEKDMAEMAKDEETRRWWKLTDAMQESFVEGATGSGGDIPWWKNLEEVFRFEGSQ